MITFASFYSLKLSFPEQIENACIFQLTEVGENGHSGAHAQNPAEDQLSTAQGNAITQLQLMVGKAALAVPWRISWNAWLNAQVGDFEWIGFV